MFSGSIEKQHWDVVGHINYRAKQPLPPLLVTTMKIWWNQTMNLHGKASKPELKIMIKMYKWTQKQKSFWESSSTELEEISGRQLTGSRIWCFLYKNLTEKAASDADSRFESWVKYTLKPLYLFRSFRNISNRANVSSKCNWLNSIDFIKNAFKTKKNFSIRDHR